MGMVTFGYEKNSSEHSDMGSSFEDLNAMRPTVKTDRKSDKRFELQKFLNVRIFSFSKKIRGDVNRFVFSKHTIQRIMLCLRLS